MNAVSEDEVRDRLEDKLKVSELQELSSVSNEEACGSSKGRKLNEAKEGVDAHFTLEIDAFLGVRRIGEAKYDVFDSLLRRGKSKC